MLSFTLSSASLALRSFRCQFRTYILFHETRSRKGSRTSERRCSITAPRRSSLYHGYHRRGRCIPRDEHAPSLMNGSTNGWSSAARITRPTDDVVDVTESLGSWASRAGRRRPCSLLLLLVLGTPTRKGEVRIITLKCPLELTISKTQDARNYVPPEPSSI
jgi:hypothetical protein